MNVRDNTFATDTPELIGQTTTADAPVKLSRRRFLSATGLVAAGLTLGFAVPGASRLARAAAPASTLNAFLRIDAEGICTVICGLSEMGQGVHTSIPMLIAEELDADWASVRVEQAPVDKAFTNPIFKMQATGGSTSIRGHYEPMRKAGATARAMLVAAAAAAWKVPASECRTEKGRVIHSSGRSMGYGELAEAASRQSVPADAPLKADKDLRILGHELRRLDTPKKVDGSAQYGMDVRLPGMLTAVMARLPVPGAKVVSFDATKAKAVPGVRQVLQIPSGVAVLADGYWAAKKGRDLLDIQWDAGALGKLSSADVTRMLTEASNKVGAVGHAVGDVGAVRPARTLEAHYEAPYLSHTCMEPLNCTAWVQADGAEIWAGTQSQGPSQGIVSQVAGVAAGKVKINTMYLGGGFGRRFAPDFTIDATMLSKASGKPVKLVYTREDDTRAWFYRPAGVTRFSGGLDAAGNAVSFTASVASPSIMESSGFMKIPPSGVDHFAVEGTEDHPYDFPNQRIDYSRVEPGVRVWFWRSVGHSQNIFFTESFVDEMAAAAGKDPFEFRRNLLGKQPRYRGVLELAAARAGWGSPLPAGVHRGIAVGQSFGSYVAEVAEVSVAADGSIKLHRVVCAVDCGRTVNPAIIKRQMESAIIYGMTAALYGKITLKEGRVEQGNFHDYPMVRINEVPPIEVHIVDSHEKPGGVGEPGLPPLAPAVANAIFAATGKRLRQLPFDTTQLKRA
jgi:isoquinoline 1-oxidoreductase beta subunit